MKGMIFAAGAGTRLKPVTDNMPKALVKVGGVPMLEHVICRMIDCGISKIVINSHYFSHMIEDFIDSKNHFGINIHISYEKDKALETGGGLLKCRELLQGDDVLLHNADILTDLPLQDMILRHEISDNDITLLCMSRATSRYILKDHTSRMKGWYRKDTGEVRPEGVDFLKMTPVAFGGIHVIGADVWSKLAKFGSMQGEAFSIMQFYIAFCNVLNIGCYEPEKDYKWFDIGKPETLYQAELEWK